MSGYLQRLYDRAAAAPIAVPLPAAASLSPIAQADQRLTVPEIGEALMTGAPLPVQDDAWDEATPDEPVAASDTSMGRAAHPPAPRRRAREQTRAPQPAADPPAPSAREEEAAQIPRPAAPIVDASAAQPSPFARIGAIAPTDFELPAEPTDAMPAPIPSTPAPAATPPGTQSALSPEAKPVRAPTTTSAAPVPLPSPSIAASATPVDTQPIEERDEAAVAQPASAPESTQQQPQVEPIAPRVAAPVPPPEAPPVSAPTPTRNQPPPRQPVPQRVEVLRPSDAPAKPPRPLTANEASVIGPLPIARRSAMLFGVRRR